MPNETKPEISRRDMLGLAVAGCAAIAGASLAGCAAKDAGTPGKRGAIGIIGAMDPEIASLRDALEGEKSTTIAGMEFYEGTLDGTDVVDGYRLGFVGCAALLAVVTAVIVAAIRDRDE